MKGPTALLLLGLLCIGGYFGVRFVAGTEPVLLSYGQSPVRLLDGAPGAKVKTVVHLQNISRKQITINHVQPSCGCTAVRLDRATLEPGASAQLAVEVTLPWKPGPFDAHVEVFSSTGGRVRQSMSNVELTSNVRPILEPAGIVWDYGRIDDDTAGAFEQKMQIRKGEMASEFRTFRATIDKPFAASVSGDSKEAIEVTIRGDGLENYKGIVERTVCISGARASGDIAEIVRMSVSCNRSGERQVSPRSIYAGVVAIDRQKTFELRVPSSGHEVSAVSSAPEWIAVRKLREEASGDSFVSVILNPKARNVGAFSEKVFVTDVNGKVEIPIIGYIR